MKPNLRRFFSAVLAFALCFNLFSTAAMAKTARTALITEVSGDVTVTKGGGSNPIPAFPNMPLNQGDSIETGDTGTVTVKIASPESERTIGPNSDVTIAKLVEDAGGKKSGFKVFVGSMWNKVKALATGDEDSVDTPTATMGVRGTTYLVIVNPDGTLSVVVASGLVAAKLTGGTWVASGSTTVEASKKETNGPPEVLLAPTQQISLNPSAVPADLANAVGIVDVTNVVKQADASILKAFIVDAPAIAEENKGFLDKLKEQLQNGTKPVIQRGGAVSDLHIADLNDLNKIAQNVNGLVSNVAATAGKQGKVQSSELQKLIDEANKNIPYTNAKIDPVNAKPLDPTAGVDPEAAAKKKAAQDRINQVVQQQQNDLQRQLDELSRQLSQLLNSVTGQQQKTADENSKAKEALDKQAENSYVSSLSDAEKQTFNENKKALEQPANPQPSGNNESGSGGSSGQTSAEGTVSYSVNPTSNGFELKVKLNQFVDPRKIYGAELHFLLGDGLTAQTLTVGAPVRSAKFNDATSEDTVKTIFATNGSGKAELIYAVTNFNTSDEPEFNNDEVLVTIPFNVSTPGTYTVTLPNVLFVDSNGNQVATESTSGLSATFTKPGNLN